MLILVWLVVFAGLSGLGSLVLPFSGNRQDRLFDAFWCGAFLASTSLQLIHLIAPIGAMWGIGVIVAGCAAGLRNRGAIYRVGARPQALVMLALFALWASMASTHEPPQYDFGLYHLPAVRWAESYAAVPGLANLSWPLGHTSAFFTFAAAFDAGRVTWIRSYHVIGGVFVLVLAAEGCTALVSPRRDPTTVFRAFGVVFAAMLIGNWLPTLSPDLGVAALGYAAVSRLAVLTLGDPPAQTAGGPRVLLLLAGLGATLKLTAVVYFGALGIAGLLAAPRDLRTWRALMPAAVLLAVSGGAWCATSIVQSGYLFYPATAVAFPLGWTVPADVVRRHAIETLWHTRGAGLAPAPHWIAHWFGSVVWTAGKTQVFLPLGVGAIALAVALARRRWTPRAGLFLLPAVAGSIAWVLAAPEPRFAGAIFWHLGMGAAAVVLSDAETLPAPAVQLTIRVAAATMIVLYLSTAARARELGPPWAAAAVPPMPRLTRVITDDSLAVNMPVDDDRCLDAPLPCTPEPVAGLALRRPNELGSGFVMRRSAARHPADAALEIAKPRKGAEKSTPQRHRAAE